MTDNKKIGAVVLTYNSETDLPACLDGLLAQEGIDVCTIVVDNASTLENLAAMESAFLSRMPDGIVTNTAEVGTGIFDKPNVLFVRNDKNDGYSAGNNVGARLAVEYGCDAVLIVNPDVRISDPYFLAKLWAGMQSVPDCLVASPRIINLSGCDEHPLRETQFWEDFLWIRQIGPSRFRPASHVCPPSGLDPIEAEKVHGSCLLIRSSFLEETNYLDENVFLYCEEPILAARVRSVRGRMMVFPQLEALHAHVASTKGNPNRRMLKFIKSRLYYFDTYTNYGPVKLMALHASYRIFALMHWVKARFGPT